MSAIKEGLLLSVADASRGNQRQAEALAEALAKRLHMAWSHYTVRPVAPWRWLAPRWLWGSASGFDPGLSERLDRLRPLLVVGCGRQAALATRIAKHRIGALTVQILDPRLRSDDWDLRVQPCHDPQRDQRTLITRGSLHPVNADWLQVQRDERPAWGECPAPRQLVVLGGPSRQCRFAAAEARDWVKQVAAQPAGTRWVIGSRRSPAWLRQEFATLPAALHWWDEADGENPYAAALAWADQIFLSPDSVNMLSEAAATSAQLQVFQAPRMGRRLAAFHQLLRASGRLSGDLAGDASAGWVVEPWRDLDEVVQQVIERLFADRPVLQPPK